MVLSMRSRYMSKIHSYSFHFQVFAMSNGKRSKSLDTLKAIQPATIDEINMIDIQVLENFVIKKSCTHRKDT